MRQSAAGIMVTKFWLVSGVKGARSYGSNALFVFIMSEA